MSYGHPEHTINVDEMRVSYDSRESDHPTPELIEMLVKKERERQKLRGGWGNTYRIASRVRGTYHVWNADLRPKEGGEIPKN